MGSKPVGMDAEEKKWRARSDAETLSRAEEIRADKARHSAAASHAKSEAERLMRVVATGKPAQKGATAKPAVNVKRNPLKAASRGK